MTDSFTSRTRLAIRSNPALAVGHWCFDGLIRGEIFPGLKIWHSPMAAAMCRLYCWGRFDHPYHSALMGLRGVKNLDQSPPSKLFV